MNANAALLLGLLALTTTACGASGASGVYKQSYSLTNAQAKPASLLVAKKIPRTLYLVLDPARVKDSWEMHGDGGHFALKEFQAFVRRDLKDAMQTYFERVEVVKAGDPIPAGPHVIGDVKVDKVALHDLNTGRLTYTAIEMTWSFAMRPSESQDYAFSFGGTATSSESYPTFEVGCAQMIESAIGGMLTKWTEKGGIDAFRRL
jgi:hypothetical protein